MEYLASERAAGRVAVGNMDHTGALGVHWSSFGVISKRGKAGR